MFYVAHKRIWVIIEPKEQGADILVAGSGDRHQKEFAREFQALAQLLDRQFERSN